MTSQRFCLRWNNHQSNLLSVFDQLLQDESFVDVTLAVDGRNLKAHKIVLSACSPYFQALFVGHPDRHPIVILKDIPYVDMRSLLDFMYRGEVSVDQDRLTMFLKVAESLRIKGLTEASGDNCDTLAKMGSTLTPTSHPYSALGYPQSRLKRPLSGSQHSLNSLQASNPLLGSALTGPKRKRGLPRKLSGSVSSGLDVMADVPDGEEEGEEEEEGREEDEEFDEERSVQSDSDMIERAHSPFDNKMLEVNVSEGKPAAPSPQGDSSSACNMEERGEGAGSPPCPSPQREEDEEKQASQELATNVKKERETEASGAVDQNDRNSSPVPERFPPGHRRPRGLLPSISLPPLRSSHHRKPLSKSSNYPLSQSITYDLNPHVSLTRGVVYDVDEKVDVKGELEKVEVKKGLDEEEEEEKQVVEVVRERRRRGRRPKKEVQADCSGEAAHVVECEDVLRSLMTSSLASAAAPDEQDGYIEEAEEFGSGVHFLTSESLLSFIQSSSDQESCSSDPSPPEEDVLTRKDLLEYLMNKDGSCVCKLCGEVLTSRTHWYRHKYKVHTPAHLALPPVEKSIADLHTCRVCKQYFKSKKGYLGHVHAKHNSEYAREVSAQVTPVLPSVGEVSKFDKVWDEKDYGKAREMEEQLVKDIIAKVRRECEQEGDGVMMMMRRGYAKKMKK